MVVIEPVIEVFGLGGFLAWPVGAGPSPRFMALSGELALADVGTVMAVIAVYNQFASASEEDEQPSPARLIQLIAQADPLVAPGGLRVRDSAAGLAVNPGCCCGLETWHEWNEVATGREPWLGHSPAPWVENLGHQVRVWPDGGDTGFPSAGACAIEIPASDLPGLLARAHRQLHDLLYLLEPWAHPLAGAAADGLRRAVAAQFHVGWPAPAPPRRRADGRPGPRHRRG
jgi:hypothetical protein